MTQHVESSLYVTWRHPKGRIHPVGLLTRRVSNGSESYRFVYLKSSEALPGFKHLPGLPDHHTVYKNEKLFPVFRNRQMPHRRPDYRKYVSRLNLGIENHPFEVMARNEGRKLTDRIEVFAPPIRTDDAKLTTSFFVRGIRRLEGALKAVLAVRTDDFLALVDDPDNEMNPQAIRVVTREHKPVGWVPEYLLNTVHELRERTGENAISVTVQHVNLDDASPSMRLICRLTAPWPDDYQPFSGPEFQPIGS